MVNILLAGTAVGFQNRYPDLEWMCRGYESALPPELTIRVTQEELEEERKKQEEAFSDGYLETVCCYRKAANRLLSRDTFVLHGSVVELNGEGYVFLAPSGGGKTTLLKVILGLLKPYNGEVIYPVSRQNLFGYLPQNSRFDQRFPIDVTEVVLSGLMSEKGLYKSYTRAEKQKAWDLLDQYGMGAYKKAPIGDLSGGQMQRVFLCRAVIASPRILILDEPTTYVDSNFEKEFYTILEELNKSLSIVMVSHDLGTICSYVKTIACVNRELHYHNSNLISAEQLQSYHCPIELITHGKIPHRVLKEHEKGKQ